MADPAVNTQNVADYLAQLLKDRKQVTAFPNLFMHVERLLDDGKFIMLEVRSGVCSVSNSNLGSMQFQT